MNFKQMVKTAQANPNDPRNVELYNGIRDGLFDDDAIAEGVDISSLSESFTNKQKLNKSFEPVIDNTPTKSEQISKKIAETQLKAADVLNIDELGEGAGNALVSGFVAKTGEEAMQLATDSQSKIIERINQAKASGDTESLPQLEKALEYSNQALEQASQIQQGFVEDLPSNREVIGSAISLAALAASGKAATAVSGKVASVAPKLVQGATTASGRIAQAGVQSAIQGATAGGAEATGRAIGEAESVEEGLKIVGKDALIGGVAGGILGSGVQKVSEVLDARTLSKLDDATKNIGTKKQQKVNKKLEDALSPKINSKAKQKALAEGRVIEGKSSKITGKKPDVIKSSDDVIEIRKTVNKLIPDADKLPQQKLVTEMQSNVSKVSEELRPELKKALIANNQKKRLSKQMSELFKKQAIDPDFDAFAGSKKAQKNFSNIVDDLLKKKNVSQADIWDARIKYDNLVKNSVKQADDVTSEASKIFQRNVWLENRDLLNKLMKDGSSKLAGKTKSSFKDMSNLYEGINNIVTKGAVDLKGTKGLLSTKNIIKGGAGLAGAGALGSFVN